MDLALRLAFNEPPSDWPRWLKERVLHRLMAADWNRYPEVAADLEARLAAFLGLSADAVIAGAGSYALADLALRTMGQTASRVILARPSFEQYEVACAQARLPVAFWDLDDELQYSAARFPSAPGAALVLVASPNNPTGTVLREPELCQLLEQHPSATFVLDEAYQEFGSITALPLVKRYENLFVLRTFSKGVGVAGARFGYLVGQPSRLLPVRGAAPPFSLNLFSWAVACEYLEDSQARTELANRAQGLAAERDRVARLLARAPWLLRVFPSEANFLLLDLGTSARAHATCSALGQAGIAVRAFSPSSRVGSCLRLTLGRRADNDRMLRALDGVPACRVA